MTLLIGRKLQLLLDYLEEFKKFSRMRFAEYERDKIKRRAAERLIQLLVEVGSDIAGIILSEKEGIIPESYYESFIKLGERKIIPLNLAKKLAASTGLRNRIIHEYGEYKDSIVFANIKPLYNSYLSFYLSVRSYLKSEKRDKK
jgi:uncharacterized protein YutE (UPF0331/DUF86 family)